MRLHEALGDEEAEARPARGAPRHAEELLEQFLLVRLRDAGTLVLDLEADMGRVGELVATDGLRRAFGPRARFR